ncbi:MAG: lipoprotein signal peptidase [Candidatus Nephrothrix sp. EaCA]|nr:MAG: lipoprotein signal peptidase [Candidatus Nephrothrix sp. EaCA]
MKICKYFLISLAVILIDQSLKLWVYHNYQSWPGNIFGEHELKIFGDWFRLHYLLNPGMAFGLKWDNEFGKLALTLFRIVAMIGIIYYMLHSFRKNLHVGFLVSLGLILGGAIGNVIDSAFYGVWLNNAPPDSPTPWFHGQVIDMLFFPLFDVQLPNALPLIGGKGFLFFSPVFNIADSSIFIGVSIILIFQKKFFPQEAKTTEPATDSALEEEPLP